MHSSFSPILRRLLPVAFAAVALAFVQYAPSLADSAPQQQVCGSVDLNSASSGDAAKAFDCFNGAFATCASATLVATGQNAGIATTWTFVTVDGDDHGCSISETLERGTGSSKTTDAYLCRMVSRDKDGLRFSGCGSQKEVALRVAATLGASTAVQPVVQQPNPSKS